MRYTTIVSHTLTDRVSANENISTHEFSAKLQSLIQIRNNFIHVLDA
jgi:hypothetical protein